MSALLADRAAPQVLYMRASTWGTDLGAWGRA